MGAVVIYIAMFRISMIWAQAPEASAYKKSANMI